MNYCEQCGVFGEAELAPVNSAGVPCCWNCGGISNPCDIDDSSETAYESESECSQCGGDMDIECWLLSCQTEKLHRLLHDPDTIKEDQAS